MDVTVTLEDLTNPKENKAICFLNTFQYEPFHSLTVTKNLFIAGFAGNQAQIYREESQSNYWVTV